MKMSKFGLALASVLGLSTLGAILGTSATAAPPPDVFKDSDGNVYIHGTIGNGLGEAADIELTGQNAMRTVRAGYCGELRLAASSSFPSIGSQWKVNGGTAINGSSMTMLSGDLLLGVAETLSLLPPQPASKMMQVGFI